MALLNSLKFWEKIKADLKIFSFLDLANSFVENYESIVSQTDTVRKLLFLWTEYPILLKLVKICKLSIVCRMFVHIFLALAKCLFYQLSTKLVRQRSKLNGPSAPSKSSVLVATRLRSL